MKPAINYTRRSPNYDDRPPGTIIDSLVIHTTEGVWPTDLDWLCSSSSGVSCHYVLAPKPEFLPSFHQGVKFRLSIDDGILDRTAQLRAIEE